MARVRAYSRKLPEVCPTIPRPQREWMRLRLMIERDLPALSWRTVRRGTAEWFGLAEHLAGLLVDERHCERLLDGDDLGPRLELLAQDGEHPPREIEQALLGLLLFEPERLVLRLEVPVMRVIASSAWGNTGGFWGERPEIAPPRAVVTPCRGGGHGPIGSWV